MNVFHHHDFGWLNQWWGPGYNFFIEPRGWTLYLWRAYVAVERPYPNAKRRLLLGWGNRP